MVTIWHANNIVVAWIYLNWRKKKNALGFVMAHGNVKSFCHSRWFVHVKIFSHLWKKAAHGWLEQICSSSLYFWWERYVQLCIGGSVLCSKLGLRRYALTRQGTVGCSGPIKHVTHDPWKNPFVSFFCDTSTHQRCLCCQRYFPTPLIDHQSAK